MADHFKYHIVPHEDDGGKETFLEYFLGTSPSEAEEVYKEFSEMLNKMAYSYASNSGLEKRDIFSEALVGLARAKRDYDKARSDNFKNYAIVRIKSAINDFIRKSVEVFSIPAYIKLANSNIVAIKYILFAENIDDDAVNYIIISGRIDTLDINDSLKKRCISHVENLKKAAYRANIELDELVKRAEYIPSAHEYDERYSGSNVFEDNLLTNIMIEKLKDKMDIVDRDIAQRILSGQSYTEIGKAYNKSKGWALKRMTRFGNRLRKNGLLK